MDARFYQQMILWTFCLAVGLGIVSYFILIQPPAQFAKQDVAPVTSGEVRTPASDDNISTETTSLDAKNLSQAVEISLNCKTQNKSQFSAGVKLIRITADFCKSTKKSPQIIVKSTVQNLTNKFMATVFYPSPRTYTTDYISLEPGVNRIEIHHEFQDGSTEDLEFLAERLKTET